MNDTRIWAIIVILSGIIFLLDVTSPTRFVFWTLYLIPLFLTVYVRYRFAAVAVGIGIVVLSLEGIFIGNTSVPLINTIINRVFFSAIIVVLSYFIWNYRDSLSSARKSREELGRAHNLLKNHLGNSPLATIEFDPHLRIVRWTEISTRMFGWTADEVMGKKVGEFPWIHDDDYREVSGIFTDLLIGKIPRNMHVNRNYRKDGSVIICEWYNSALIDKEGNLISILSQALDVTGRTLAESQIKESLKEKDALIAEIHHRVRNNLTAFISLLNLEGDYENTPECKALRLQLQNRAWSMALVHETLYRTKNYSKVDMDFYLTSLVERISATSPAKIPVVTTVIAEGITIDIARAAPCGLIVNELMTNAFMHAFPESAPCNKNNPDPCTFRVSFTRNEGYYIFTVSDNGIGLPASVDIGTTQSLGLKLVNFLVHYQLRGIVDVETGEGTKYTIRFRE